MVKTPILQGLNLFYVAVREVVHLLPSEPIYYCVYVNHILTAI